MRSKPEKTDSAREEVSQMDFRILPFTIAWYGEAFSLWQQCEGIGLSSADSKENVQAYLERNQGMSFVAAAGNRLVGSVLAGHDGRRGYIYHLAVAPQWRRRGLGRRLLEKCLEALKEAGIRKCHLFLLNGNAGGLAFWKSAGWLERPELGVVSKSLG